MSDQKYLHALREYLLVQLNVDFVHRKVQGFVEDFDHLRSVIDSHNTFDTEKVAKAKADVLELGPSSDEDSQTEHEQTSRIKFSGN